MKYVWLFFGGISIWLLNIFLIPFLTPLVFLVTVYGLPLAITIVYARVYRKMDYPAILIVLASSVIGYAIFATLFETSSYFPTFVSEGSVQQAGLTIQITDDLNNFNQISFVGGLNLCFCLLIRLFGIKKGDGERAGS